VTRRSRIQEEIKQRKPFRSIGQEAVISLLRTADVVRSHFEKQLAPYGVTLQQYNVLRILRGAGASGLPTLEIGARMVERTPGVTRLIDRLERKGLVRRVRGTEDRRVVYCHLSDHGRDTLAALDDVVDRADVTALEALSDTELEQLIEMLGRARAAHD
jgi:DNA-binding MarR family transcriptional regulator